MTTQSLPRRTLLIAAAGAAAALPFHRASSQAATPPAVSLLTEGSWLDQVKAQHQAIADQLTAILADEGVSFTLLQSELKHLSYLLSAHAVAEENVLYPALTRHQLEIGAADLYLEQQWQKVWNADIDVMAALVPGLTADIKQRIERLQGAILEHAMHEVEQLYPKLWAKATSGENAELSVLFARLFKTVSPVA